MDLTARVTHGFTRDGETYCCAGCANGTGCTCVERAFTEANRAGGGAHQAFRYPSRKAGTRLIPKRKRNVTKQRDSTREQARGRSEFTGTANVRAA
jgi:hypothetical protein